MNVDDAMQTAAAYLAAHEQEDEPLFDSEEVAITLAAEVERLRVWKTRWKDAAQKLRRQLEEAGDGDNWRRACRRVELELEKTRTEVKRLRAELAAAKVEIESVVRLGPHPVEQVQMPLATFVKSRMVARWEYNALVDKLEKAEAELAEAKADVSNVETVMAENERLRVTSERLAADLAAAKAASVPTDEESRQAFESGFYQLGWLINVKRHEDDGEYQDFVVQKFWAGWQAAINWLRERMRDTTPPTT